MLFLERVETNTPKVVDESFHRYYPNDDEESDGGKSIAFLRLGRSGVEAKEKAEDIRKEVDQAMKTNTGSCHPNHTIKKRSSQPESVDEALINDIMLEDPDENEMVRSPVLGNLAITNHYDTKEKYHDDEFEDTERESSSPYQEVATDDDLGEAYGYMSDLNSVFPNEYSMDNFLSKRNSFDLRPMKRGNFAFRPMKKSNFAFRPMKRSNFAFRPMKKNNFAFRPMKKNNFDFRPMKRSNFAFRPMKKNSFALRPVKKGGFPFLFFPTQKGKRITPRIKSKDNFLRYGKRGSFALRPMKRPANPFTFRPMKRPEDSFVLRPMKKDNVNSLGSISEDAEKRNSFSLRPMKKNFQFRPMKRRYNNYELQNSWMTHGRPVDQYQRIEDYQGINSLF